MSLIIFSTYIVCCGENFPQSSRMWDLESRNFQTITYLFRQRFIDNLPRIVLIRMLLGRLHIKKRSEPLCSPLLDWIIGRNFQLSGYVELTYMFGKCPLSFLLKLYLILLRKKVCQGSWIHLCKWDCTSRTWYWKLLIARHLLSWAYELLTGRKMAAVVSFA